MSSNHTTIDVLSCFTTCIDPYRAGLEIGEQLATIAPEVIFLFTSIHYNGSSEIMEGIYDALPDTTPLLIGNSGDGFYEKNRVANIGISAMGINAHHKIQWHLEYAEGISKSPFEATKKCITQLNQKGSPTLYYLAADFRTDSNEIIKAINQYAKAPVIGGLSGDDYTLERSFVYTNRTTRSDTVAILSFEGDFVYEILTAQDMKPIGNPGKITQNRGNTITSINHLPAMDFVEQVSGKPVNIVDEGTIVFKISSEDAPEQKQIRSLLLPESPDQSGKIRLLSGSTRGNNVQVCLASPEEMLQDILSLSRRLNTLSFSPFAALIVSCAGRKKLLGDEISHEVTLLTHNCTTLKAVAGFPSFGEFGPLKMVENYTPSLFHNMTFILLLLGERLT